MSQSLDIIFQELDSVQTSFETEIQQIAEPDALETLRVKYLGRKGQVAQFFKKIGTLPGPDRPRFGERLNALKTSLQSSIDEAQSHFSRNNGESKDKLDLSLPGIAPSIGHRNALMLVLDEIKYIFRGMGFGVRTGRLIENEYYNFEALNVPDDHPSKDLQDTFYLENALLLRTHTSPVQIHTMENENPPIRIIAPGRCFRKDAPDATHSPEFHQVEGLAVGEGISLSHLKGTLVSFARKLFGEDTQVRFRPSFFPFTEPSAEMDVYFDDRLGWLEILGSGMVDPNVFEAVKIDPDKYTGFAFGMGVERIAMLKYQIDDIRHFYENDTRFLRQF